MREDRVVCFWVLRRDGKREAPSSPPLSALEGYVKLEWARGDRLFGFISDDGKAWTALEPYDLALPHKVHIGVDAISVSDASRAELRSIQAPAGREAVDPLRLAVFPAAKESVSESSPEAFACRGEQ